MSHHVQPFYRRRRAWPGRHYSQSGNKIHVSLSSYNYPLCTVQPGTPWCPPQRLTGCWRSDISHPPRHAPCSTVQLITVTGCPVSPSLYSRWLRPEPTQRSESQPRVIMIRLVPDRKWSPRIPRDLIAIKCWSRQALVNAEIRRSSTHHGRWGEPKLLWATTAMFLSLQKSTRRCWSK